MINTEYFFSKLIKQIFRLTNTDKMFIANPTIKSFSIEIAISCLPDLAKGHDTFLREKLVIFVFVKNKKT